MFRQFAQKVEEMRRLIDDSRSASLSDCVPVNSRETKDVPMGQGRFLLAVSGGMDSMCMADLFLQTLGADSFAIAHCNFSLRGEESDGDEAMVREWAENNGVRIFVKRFDTASYAQENGISIEMAARDLRYGWFSELCREHGFAALSVAHNANDNAETLMLNLLRGTGLKGLHGMSEISEMCATGKVPEDGEDMPPPARGCLSVARTGVFGISGTLPVAVCRPLLEFTRKQIEGYVLFHNVPYRHDSSNFSSDYKRNKIRNEVFPVFEKINPSFIRTLNREIGYFAEAGTIVEDWCRSQLPSVLVVPSDDSASSGIPSERSESRHISISTLALLSTPHWRYLLYYILEPYGFNSQTIASIESLLASDRTLSGKHFESPTHTLLTTRNSLMVVPSASRDSASSSILKTRPASGIDRTVSHDGRTAFNHGDAISLDCRSGVSEHVMVVRGSGMYNFNGSRFSVELLDRTPDMPLKQPAGTLILDADKMKFPFVCRRWRRGDWLIPLGMRGKKKISDLFADMKYNALQKDAAIILVDTCTSDLAEQQHVAALLGHRIDDRYKVLTSTRTVLRISVL